MSSSIRDVAASAGVSLTTVSQVLNGRENARIAPATQERVRRAAQELNYQPNRLARSLIMGRTDTIGMMISGFRNPFFVQLLESMEQMIQAAGYQSLLDAAPSFRGSYRAHGELRSWPVDGVLMWAHASQQVSDYLHGTAIPVVYLGAQRRGDRSDAVSFDLYGGARQAAEHVIERGHKRIAHVAPYEFSQWSPEEERSRGFRDACAEHGLPLETIVATEQAETREAGWHLGQLIAGRSKAKRPQALLCHNDVMAVGVYHGLRRAGLRVPENIAVVGVDGIEEGLYLDRPLTSVVIPAEEICRRALDILLKRIAGNQDDFPQQVVVPTTLRIGEST
jgi:LacI family transcriptional regulator